MSLGDWETYVNTYGNGLTFSELWVDDDNEDSHFLHSNKVLS